MKLTIFDIVSWCNTLHKDAQAIGTANSDRLRLHGEGDMALSLSSVSLSIPT